MENQKRMPLYQALLDHIKQKPVSFHVPGHKYGAIFAQEGMEQIQQAAQIDATELSGLDDLHSPEGVIKEAEELLAALYQVKQSFFLVNGSTVGNLAMVLSVCEKDDIVLVQRNCHKSVLNAIKLAKACPVFLEPEYDPEWKTAGGVSLETVKQGITSYPEAKALIVTYPNYYGMVYDLKSIIDHAHLHDIPVLVDEAHGPHFIIDELFPASAIQLGADIIIQSAHKTLPALTMGSFLHINSNRVNTSKLRDYLQILQSSSPSYLIMASLDLARHFLARYDEKDLKYLESEVASFRNELSTIPCIKVLKYNQTKGDILRVTIQTRCRLSGFELQQKFEKIGIYTELADPYNVLFILPLLKENQAYPLYETSRSIKSILADVPYHPVKIEMPINGSRISQLAIPYDQMSKIVTQLLSIEDAIGKVCAETIIPYPPGIPLMLMGELITDGKVKYLKQLIKTGARFQGGPSLDKGLIKIFRTS